MKQMFNFTPPHAENVAKGCALALVVFLFLAVYMRGYQAGMCEIERASTCGAEAPKPVEISKSLFYNPDSIAYYSAMAACEDNPRALFIVGMAAHLRVADPDYPEDITTVPLDEADYYILRAAELGSPDALAYIRCRDYHGCWNHFIPE